MEDAEVVLIDTSSWIEALRSAGRSDIREKVQNLMLDGRAAWCDMVAVELWNGARGDYEKKRLAELEKEILCLRSTEEVWMTARELARSCRKAGQTVPSADLVICACAIAHRAGLEHCDEHIEFILKTHSARKKKL